uniref:Uncharacterized protein n=1 Tax=Rhizophora mucronata TaxID=61149 RepID=A0A2P2PDE1_RHIMU
MLEFEIGRVKHNSKSCVCMFSLECQCKEAALNLNKQGGPLRQGIHIQIQFAIPYTSNLINLSSLSLPIGRKRLQKC